MAYGGLNSAVAGAISNMAICMIKNEEATIFGDFPGQASYETIIDTITRGNLDKIQYNVKLALSAPAQSSQAKEATFEGDVDVKELLLSYAYEDLVDFVTDFQKNGTGKPTKAMMAKLSDWTPTSIWNTQRTSSGFTGVRHTPPTGSMI